MYLESHSFIQRYSTKGRYNHPMRQLEDMTSAFVVLASDEDVEFCTRTIWRS